MRALMCVTCGLALLLAGCKITGERNRQFSYQRSEAEDPGPIMAQQSEGQSRSRSAEVTEETVTLGGGTGSEGMESVDAFAGTVYPLLTQECASCHAEVVAPRFAAEDVAASHLEVVKGAKVDFEHPKESRLVQRLVADKHNCWGDCDANGQEMTEAIREWISKMGDRLPKDLLLRTAALPVADGSGVNATEGDIVFLVDEADRGAEPLTLGFELTRAGQYRVYCRNVPGAAAATLKVKLGEGDEVPLAMPSSPTASWVAVPGTTRLEKGVHQLSLGGAPGLPIDRVALSRNPAFDGAPVNQFQKLATLDFDLGGITGVAGTRLLIDVMRFDEFSYKFVAPRIVAPKEGLRVKGLGFAINGKVDPRLATFGAVDQILSTGETLLSEAALVAPKDKGENQDEIFVTFEFLAYE